MLILGAVVILFILALFLSMLGSGPRSEAEWRAEWQNDADFDAFVPADGMESKIPAVNA